MRDIFIMDMGGHDSNVRALQSKFPHARTLRWTDHLGTIRRAMPRCRTQTAWIVSSWIDYSDFDWLWEPPPWQSHQIHCWPSGQNRLGDTFLVPRDQWNAQNASLEYLEHFQHVNFEHPTLRRLPWQHKPSTDKSLEPQPMDVVFISYDEPQADLNWEKLKQNHPRALRVHGVAGMERALEAAADSATTPWYFAVFAKTEIHPEFGFDFVPDYMRGPKHYIFDCLNSVNGLQYGHMGVVLYNCRGIREQNRRPDGFGLDYTMSWPHEHIPLLSCVSNFDTTAYHAWRTAFREAAKLSWFERVQPTIDGAYRLRVWTTRAQGPQAKWCLLGAQEGVEFAQSCNSLNDIKQSFRWTWLRERFVTQHGPLD